MDVQLIDFTGAGAADPARAAANVLVFTKQTRMEMVPGLMDQIALWPQAKIDKELAYMANTIPSSWEFVEYKFLINGVSRAFTHQFVRTRTGSYAQQTMRVLNVSGWDHLIGPTIAVDDARRQHYLDAIAAVAGEYDWQVANGAAIEDARGILPTNILTNIVAKFDLRTLADTVRKRSSSRTQGEYRAVLEAMIAEVKRVHPWASMFLERTFDLAAGELEREIIACVPPGSQRMAMIKLLDQMRATS